MAEKKCEHEWKNVSHTRTINTPSGETGIEVVELCGKCEKARKIIYPFINE